MRNASSFLNQFIILFQTKTAQSIMWSYSGTYVCWNHMHHDSARCEFWSIWAL